MRHRLARSMPARVLKLHLIEEEELSDMGFTHPRITIDVVPLPPPEPEDPDRAAPAAKGDMVSALGF